VRAWTDATNFKPLVIAARDTKLRADDRTFLFSQSAILSISARKPAEILGFLRVAQM
jgi:hypothetical protein